MKTNPFDTLKKVGNVLQHSQQTEALCRLTPLALFRVALACVHCDYDVVPSDLTTAEMYLAMELRVAKLNESLRRLD